MPFWQFFRKGWDGRALSVRPSKMHHRIGKILFVLSADEYLECAYSFMLKFLKITVWCSSLPEFSEMKYLSVPLKVRQSRNDFFKLVFLPKNERTNSTLLLWYFRLTKNSYLVNFSGFQWQKCIPMDIASYLGL